MELCPKCLGLKAVMTPINCDDKYNTNLKFGNFNCLKSNKQPIDPCFDLSKYLIYEFKPCKLCKQEGVVTKEEAIMYNRHKDMLI